jgi:prevent-host-death family protein
LTNNGDGRQNVLMTKVNLYDAKTNLSELVERAAAGEEIVIAKAGRPRARLVRVESALPERRPGRARGRIHIAPDFDAPLPPEIAEAFGA